VTVCGDGVGLPGDASASTSGLTAGSSGVAGDAVTSVAPLRSSASDGSDALRFTGAASDLLAVLGVGLVAAGFLVVRATRPDTATKRRW
jgi:hypothetical protein